MTAKRKVKSKPCKGCAHNRSETGSRGGEEICHYILDTGEPRGCLPENCNKRITRLPPRPIPVSQTKVEEYYLRRAKLCGNKERAIFARGKEHKS